MIANEREKLRSWVLGWKEVDAVQAQLRRRAVRDAKTSDSIKAFNLAFRSAMLRSAKRTTSGLVEFHKIMVNSK